MLKILVNAYACSPNMGSEPGMAWNWCIHLAKHCEMYIITEGEFRDKIDAVLATLPQGKNMHFYYQPVSEEVRKMCWNQGDWRFYKYYKTWQYKTYELAQQIVTEQKIDVLHQLNMIGFREPGYLWKIKDLPFIWGPVDAKDAFPVKYLVDADLKTKAFTYLKNTITKFQLYFSKRVRKAVDRANFVVSASSNSKKTFKKYFDKHSPLINETGCRIQALSQIKNTSNKEILDILWVGKLDFRKQLTLALKSVSNSNNKSVRLHIIGGGESTKYQENSKEYGISEQCIWHGMLSHQEVQNIMQSSDLLLFTSIAEGTPHVVLEAISNGLPVLCFDTCGQGDSVNEKVGIKIPLSNPEQSVKDFSEKINFLYHNREVLKQLSENCATRQIELSWDKKAEQMLKLYEKVVNKKDDRQYTSDNRVRNK